MRRRTQLQVSWHNTSRAILFLAHLTNDIYFVYLFIFCRQFFIFVLSTLLAALFVIIMSIYHFVIYFTDQEATKAKGFTHFLIAIVCFDDVSSCV